MTVNNLGMVNHAHVYETGRVSEHMHCQVYTEAEGKKGVNNVASLNIKTLQVINVLREDSVGGELNIVFDNCTGQNKNNTVLKLPAWLVQCGYFLEVNFIFLVVGHTKNAADRLFNLLKKDYRKKNIYTFNELIENLSASSSVTVYPAEAADFLPYNKLLGRLYKDLTGNVKTNHIFSCRSGNDDEIVLRKSALEDHNEFIIRVLHRQYQYASPRQMLEIADEVLVPIECLGVNPYKAVEMFRNYRPIVPIQYHSDKLYAQPSPEVMAKVKMEKVDRKEFRAKLTKKKYSKTKDKFEEVAFGDVNRDYNEDEAVM